METTMTTRALGTTGLHITPLGFGAWAIGGDAWKFGWGPQDDADSVAAIHRALERGMNWIDTAAAYGFGHSEEIVARALRGMAHPPLVFTKCGLVPSAAGDGGTREDLSRASIVAECEASLRRLCVETIDLYQIHWPTDELADIDEGWAALNELKAAGKVRHIGVSNFSIPELERARRVAPVETLQPPYSLVRDDFERGLATYCREWNIGVIVYAPMQSGLLTGAMTAARAQALPATDWRSRSDEFREPKLARNLALVERLRAVGARYGRSPGEVAIAWTLRDAVVGGAIVGARTAAQVDGIAAAATLALDADDLRTIAGDPAGSDGGHTGV
ncbi:MAG: aldo/keto reductase [Vulcanimicrobiaceae bacterium]